MNTNKLLDLRFLIGLFFLLVGLILIGYYVAGNFYLMKTEAINLWTGLFFSCFGLVMIVSFLVSGRK